MTNMGNRKRFGKYQRRIKIRLADPNIPESYVCEVYDSDSPVELDEKCFQEIENSSPRKIDNSKLKSYFEILMSNECKPHSRLKSINEKSNRKTKIFKTSNDNKTKIIKQKTCAVPQKLKTNKMKENFVSDSSDDETILQMQKKWESGNSLVKSLNNFRESRDITEKKKNHSEPNINISKESELIQSKKNINILNYFGKVQNVDKEKNINIVNERLEVPVNYSKEKLAVSNALNKLNQNGDVLYANDVKHENVKLAPLFLMKGKSASELAKQKDRHDFLHKEAKILKMNDSNKTEKFVLNFYPVCHVQQRDDSTYWSRHKVSFPTSELVAMNEFKTDLKFRFKINENKILNGCINYPYTRKSSKIDINNTTINKLKMKYSDLQLDIIIDGLKFKQDKFMKISGALLEPKLDNKISPKNEFNIDTLNSLWTEKYKPSSYEILGNDITVKKLKKWLQSWKNFDDEMKALAKSNAKSNNNDAFDDDDSDDEDDYFMKPYDGNYGLKSPSNVCILSGPSGCGKTSVVFALAEELDFNVLEVNASGKRTGKKVLSDLQEATQSHKVQQATLHQTHLDNKETKKKKLKLVKKKNSKMIINGCSDEGKNKKISLLLIEDADIVFDEHDDGFYSAIMTLVQTSKRPFIFITNDPDCVNLDCFKMEDSLLLQMKHPMFYKSCALLEVVSVLEGVPIRKEVAEFLVLQNNLDLRKSLLELQFWGEASERIFKCGRTFDLGTLWWSIPNFWRCESTISFSSTSNIKRKRKDCVVKSSKKLKMNHGDDERECSPVAEYETDTNSSFIRMSSSLLDIVSLLDIFGLTYQETLLGGGFKVRDSLSLEENMEDVIFGEESFKENLCSEISNLLVEIFFENKQENIHKKEFRHSFPSWEDICWRNNQEEAREEMFRLVPFNNGRNQKSVDVDYLPVIRNICRMEKDRSMLNLKRKNRFLHYFGSAGFHLSDTILETSCNILTT